MTQNELPESTCPHGGDCQTCAGGFSFVRGLAAVLFVALAIALAQGKMKPFQAPDRSEVETPAAQISQGSKQTANGADAQASQRLSVEDFPGESVKTNPLTEKALPSFGETTSLSERSESAAKLRQLPPVAHPLNELNRFTNAVRAAKSITIEYESVTVTVSDSETVDLTATLERISKGIRDQHRNDGTEFRNRERRLPSRPPHFYTEFVHRVSERTPGACRIIIGQEGDIWYTPDHYQLFIPVSDQARNAQTQRSRKGHR